MTRHCKHKRPILSNLKFKVKNVGTFYMVSNETMLQFSKFLNASVLLVQTIIHKKSEQWLIDIHTRNRRTIRRSNKRKYNSKSVSNWYEDVRQQKMLKNSEEFELRLTTAWEL